MRRRVLAILLCSLLPLGCGDRGVDPNPGPPPDSPRTGLFRSAETCGACHPRHLAEWETSMHAFGGVDPVMLAMAEIAANEPGASIGNECLECHSPARVRLQEFLDAGGDPALSDDLSLDGVSCDVCHSVQVVPPVADISYLKDVDPHGPKLGGLRDPVPNDFHESLFDNSYTTSINCAPCHQVNFDDGSPLENTYEEWEDSIYGGFPVQCQECHMPKYTGTAALGGPVRPDLHEHKFVGVDYAYEPFRGIDLDAQKDDIRQLLQRSVRAAFLGATPGQVAAGGSFAFSVEVENDQTGHSIPSGTSFSREMWIRIDVTDGTGASLYRSGWLEPNDDLVDPSVDPALEIFGSTMFDASGTPTNFTFRAASIDDSKLLAVGQTRVADYTVDVPTGTTGPLTVTATLRFRPIKPEILRDLALDRLLPIEVFDMWTGSFGVTVTP